MGKEEKGLSQGTCIKDQCTKTTVVGGELNVRGQWPGQGRAMRGKWEQV